MSQNQEFIGWTLSASYIFIDKVFEYKFFDWMEERGGRQGLSRPCRLHLNFDVETRDLSLFLDLESRQFKAVKQWWNEDIGGITDKIESIKYSTWLMLDSDFGPTFQISKSWALCTPWLRRAREKIHTKQQEDYRSIKKNITITGQLNKPR
jgi:hypothetical protein